jgi:hypothetical protein
MAQCQNLLRRGIIPGVPVAISAVINLTADLVDWRSTMQERFLQTPQQYESSTSIVANRAKLRKKETEVETFV